MTDDERKGRLLGFRWKAQQRDLDFESVQELRAQLPDLTRALISDNRRHLQRGGEWLDVIEELAALLRSQGTSVDIPNLPAAREAIAAVNSNLELLDRWVEALSDTGDDAIDRVRAVSAEMIERFGHED